MSLDVRRRAYDIVDRLAQSHGRPSFEGEVEALFARAIQDPRLLETLQPFQGELRALSSSSKSGARSEAVD